MNKVICDVCGTRYPETSEQCPICGCAKPENARIVSGDAVGKETKASGSYTHVKGGRFSKSNVRKRNKAAVMAREEQQQDMGVEKQSASEGNNKGLVIAIVALLVAIVAVMLFIFFKYFNPAAGKEDTIPVETTTEATTLPTESTVLNYPCTGIELSSAMISLEAVGDSWLLNAQVTPENTTDAVTFTSGDPAVATVTAEGRVTAVAVGETIITVSCGNISAECTVTVTDASATTEETTAETTEATEPVSGDWKMNRKDISFTKSGDSWNLFKGSIPAEVITWTTEDATVATIENGVVTAVGPGITNVHGELDGTKFTCIIRCRFEATTDEGNDIIDATETTAPAQTAAKYMLYVNDGKVTDNKGDVSISVGERFVLTLRNEAGDVVDVDWTMSEDDICSISNNIVTGKSKGNVTVSVTYGGTTYSCIVRVKNK